MKKLILLAFLFALSAFAQNSRFDGVVQSRSGFPAPAAKVAICTQPCTVPANVSISNLPSPLAPLCSSTSDVACTQPNPVTADGLGNYNGYVAPGRYTAVFFGTGLTGRTQPDQMFACDPSNCKLSSLTVTGVSSLSSVNKGCWVGTPGYATIAAAYADTTNCLAIIMPAGYTETQSGAFHFTRSGVALICADGGSCTITNTAGWFIDAGVNHVFIGGEQPWGMNANGTNAAISFAGYTGSGVAFQVGTAVATTSFITLKNVHVDISSAGASATALKWFRTQFFYTDNFSCLPGANLQVCVTTDGTGDFTGIGEMHNSFISAGAGGTNAIGIQSGPLTTHFKISGGNISLINAGTSACLDANGGELWLDHPNANTCATGLTVEKPAATSGRAVGYLREDSGVGVSASFGAGTIGSSVYCDTCSALNPVDNGGANSFNSFYSPVSLWLFEKNWAIFGPGTGHFQIKDVVNSKTPLDIVANGNTNIGYAPNTFDAGGRLFFPAASNAGASCPAGFTNLWSSTVSNRLTHCDNGGSQLTIANTSGDTFTTTTLTSPTINGTPTGTGISTATLKSGTGAGNYTSASTTYVRPDSTNLAYTVTIPTGWKLMVHASGTALTITGIVQFGIALADGSADNTGLLVETQPIASNLTIGIPFALDWVVNGDGASHTINLQYKTTNGADSVLIANATSTFKPTMTFLLVPSN